MTVGPASDPVAITLAGGVGPFSDPVSINLEVAHNEWLLPTGGNLVEAVMTGPHPDDQAS